MTLRPNDEKFLRAAVKTGLRLQKRGSSEAPAGNPGEGVAVLQRIKASLRKRTASRKTLA